MKTKTIAEIIKKESLKSKDGSTLVGPDSEVDFTLENWNKILDESEKVFQDRQAKNQSPLSFIEKVS